MGKLVVLNKLPAIILGLYAILGVFTFALYTQDKSTARSGKWRTSESTSHLFAVIGGWPGAIIAQSKLRHKSKEMSLRFICWGTVILNCGMLGWLLSPGGTHQLKMNLKNIDSG